MRAILGRLSHGLIRSMPKSLHVVKFAVAGVAVLLSWPAAAQVTFCDTTFITANWQSPVAVFTNGTTGTATAATASGGGSTLAATPPCVASTSTNNPYRNVTLTVPAASPAEGLVYGVHVYTAGGGYNPASSGAIAKINFWLDYQCAGAAGSCRGSGQGFGPALKQGSNYYIYTGSSPAWAASSGPPTNPATWAAYASPDLTATDFSQIKAQGVVDPTSHPSFITDIPIYCGFYTANATSGASYTNNSGYDNWACAITPTILKICKVASPGVTVGTLFSFAVNTNPSQIVKVPAGSPPGGTCVRVPHLNKPIGASVTVAEVIPPGGTVSSISVAPPSQQVPNLATGTATFTIGGGVNEVTYTNQAPTGYLEICKNGTGGPFTFTVAPGNSGPIVVPANACSPAIEVPVGPVTIEETAISGVSVAACSAIPASQQVAPCNLATGTLKVNVVAGGVGTQTIANFTNTPGGCGIGCKR